MRQNGGFSHIHQLFFVHIVHFLSIYYANKKHTQNKKDFGCVKYRLIKFYCLEKSVYEAAGEEDAVGGVDGEGLAGGGGGGLGEGDAGGGIRAECDASGDLLRGVTGLHQGFDCKLG